MIIEGFHYPTHAPMVNRWAMKHQFPLPPAHLLSDIGLVVDGMACGFLYTSNSKLGMIEWIFADPGESKEKRKEALDGLFDALMAIAYQRGVQAIFSTSGGDYFSKVLERAGFQKTDTGVTHYLKFLGGG